MINNRRQTVIAIGNRRKFIITLAIVVWLNLIGLNVYQAGADTPLNQAETQAGPLQPPPSPRAVLVLQSYHQGYPWTDSVQQALADGLSGADLTLHTVYMDAKRLAENDSFRLTEELLRHWYLDQGISFEAIVAADDPALDFLLKNRDRLFPGTPVVFLGANAFDPTRLMNLTGFTGVNEEISLRETIEVLLRLRPYTRRLVVISDATQTGQRNLELMRTLAPEYAARLDFAYLTGLEPTELVESLRQLSSQDAVLYLSFLRTPAGQSLSVAESVALVSQNSPAPVFGCWDFLIGPGLVGGKVVHGASQGQAAAQMVRDILGGKKAEDIPVLMASPNEYMFDYRQLQRFSLSSGNLPEGAIVLNPPPPSWVDYWPWFAGGGAIFLVQAILITQLVISRDRLKRSGEALEQSGMQYRLTVDAAEALIHVVDRDLHILLHNQALTQRLAEAGIPTDIQGKYLPELLSFLPEKVLAEYQLVLETGQKLFSEDMIRMGETVYWTETQKIPVTGQDGKIDQIVTIVRDITERKQAAEALRESRELLLTVLNSIPVRVFWKDLNLVYLGCNTPFARDAGCETPAEVIGKDDYAIAWREQAELYRADDRMVIESGEARLLFEEPQTTPSGKRIHLLTSKVPLRNAEGTIVGVLGAYQDITERKQAEEALRLQSAALESSANAIVITDTTGAIEWVNPAFTQLTGYTAAEAGGKNPRELVKSGQHDPAFYKEIWDKILVGQVWQGELVNRKKDSSLYTEELTITPVRNQQGIISHFVAIQQDISARKALEAENRKLTEQFYQVQKMESIGLLAGGIAHDFNNLLVPITGYAEMGLMSTPPDSRLYTYFERIKNVGERAAGLTRQILAFSRRQKLEMELVDLNQVLSEFKKNLGRLIGENISLHTHLEADLPLIKADPGQLEQILLNLVVNARDAMPHGGTLNLETAKVTLDEAYATWHPSASPGEYVRLVVSDTGHGIDRATQQRIFQPFFTTKERGHGTGLGLSTVFGIVKQHGGHIWVYSEMGQGTTFKVYLQVTDRLVETAVPEPPTDERLAGDETILVVEDEAAVRQLVNSTLESFGYRVLSAGNPHDALSLAAAHNGPLQLLLTDVIMPGLDGRELYQQLSEGRPGLKVLYMSGYTDNAITHHGVLTEGAAFLQKPFAIRLLLEKVRAGLDRP